MILTTAMVPKKDRLVELHRLRPEPFELTSACFLANERVGRRQTHPHGPTGIPEAGPRPERAKEQHRQDR